jgi:ribulose-5-phosphate 4-epimerase/fuculose-1-phosphate aldolase
VRSAALALGKYRAVILPNHGAITTGPDIQMAVVAMMLLEGMVQRNISVAATARATGLEPRPIAMQHALTAKAEIARIPFMQPLWEDLLKRLRQSDADLFAYAPQAAAA